MTSYEEFRAFPLGKLTLREKCPYMELIFYGVSLRIQFEYGKIGTGKNSIFGHFSHSVSIKEKIKLIRKKQ